MSMGWPAGAYGQLLFFYFSSTCSTALCGSMDLFANGSDPDALAAGRQTGSGRAAVMISGPDPARAYGWSPFPGPAYAIPQPDAWPADGQEVLADRTGRAEAHNVTRLAGYRHPGCRAAARMCRVRGEFMTSPGPSMEQWARSRMYFRMASIAFSVLAISGIALAVMGNGAG